MARRSVLHVHLSTFAILVLGSATLVAVPERTASAATVAYPTSMAALGDSITRGFDSCGWWRDCLADSWATGTQTAVNSHYLRIRANNAAITGHVHNNAGNGALVSALADQARAAVSQRVGYVTILVGANDACAPTEAGMTAVGTFEQQFRAAMSVLASGLPDAHVMVASIPDLKRLWAAGRNNLAAQGVWSLAKICQSILARATSTAAADTARRDRVRERVMAYNAALARVCAGFARCRFDGNAVFSYPFTLAHVSPWDYFHPNRTGKGVIAQLTNSAGYQW
jgi:lysophospholipase L1-like esterase